MVVAKVAALPDHQAPRALPDVAGKRPGLSEPGVQVNADHDTGRGDLARLIVSHLMDEPDRFLFYFQDGGERTVTTSPAWSSHL